jgi:hypothetical protein
MPEPIAKTTSSADPNVAMEMDLRSLTLKSQPGRGTRPRRYCQNHSK